MENASICIEWSALSPNLKFHYFVKVNQASLLEMEPCERHLHFWQNRFILVLMLFCEKWHRNDSAIKEKAMVYHQWITSSFDHFHGYNIDVRPFSILIHLSGPNSRFFLLVSQFSNSEHSMLMPNFYFFLDDFVRWSCWQKYPNMHFWGTYFEE